MNPNEPTPDTAASQTETPETNGATPSAEARLAELEAKHAEVADAYLRAKAEAENTRRRAEREMNDARAYAIQKFARDLLGVADNLARAMQHAPTDAADPMVKNLAIGLSMTEKELTQPRRPFRCRRGRH